MGRETKRPFCPRLFFFAMNQQALFQQCQRIDGRGYKAYKALRGQYDFSQFMLFIDYVQGDPFAAPSRLRVRVPQRQAQYPTRFYDHPSRQTGLENYLLDRFAAAADRLSGRRGSGKSGLIRIDAPEQALLKRTAMRVTADFVEAQFAVGLPAAGRRVLGRQAASLLTEDIPRLVETALLFANNELAAIEQITAVVEDADFLRAHLQTAGLVAFVADGAVLPRRSGVDERPLTGARVIPWHSPAAFRHTVTLPHAGQISGTGIPTGVTLIVGGGFHGKSTLLNALEQGVYNHRPGDGRERVVTRPDAVKIRAEDGRRVAGVDISPFINNLPFGQQTTHFYSDNASGSTSQAANIIEALELGSSLLLIDEDTAATNFMIRDRRMQSLIAKAQEPITPLIDRVRQLYVEHGVSTILVIGGSGDYFDVADQVIGMEAYRAADLTAQAKQIAHEQQAERLVEGGAAFGPQGKRVPQGRSINPRRGKREVSIKVRDRHTIQFGEETIDLSAVSQLIDMSQTRAIGGAIWALAERYLDDKRPLSAAIDQLMDQIEQEGLDSLNGRLGNDFAQFRRQELGAALNRLRSLKMIQR